MKKLTGKWVVEPHNGTLIGYKMKKKLFEKKSKFQNIEIYETQNNGNIMLLDDCFMVTGTEEFVYHEMIAHVPLFSHPKPEKVLVIGGGDGGTVREILKHKTVKEVDFVEIDEEVYNVSRKYFKKLTSWHGDKRVNFRFIDGCEFIKTKKNYYDVIMIDSTDPVDIGEVLFTKKFYTDAKNALKKDGIMTAQTEDPFFDGDLIKKASNRIASVFGKTKTNLYLAYIPTYPSGCWSFTFASKSLSPAIRNKRKGIKTEYYNSEVHKAAFALPEFVKKIIK